MGKKKYINTKDVVRMTGLITNEVYAAHATIKLNADRL